MNWFLHICIAVLVIGLILTIGYWAGEAAEAKRHETDRLEKILYCIRESNFPELSHYQLADLCERSIDAGVKPGDAIFILPKGDAR